MPRKCRNRETQTQARIRQKNGDTYVYEYTSRYDPETKKNIRLRSRLLGKIPKGETEMVPTRAKKPNGEGPGAVKRAAQCTACSQRADAEASRERETLTDIMDWAGKASGIDDDLNASMAPGDAQKTASVARYFISTQGRTIPGIETWELSHPMPYPEWLSDDSCYELFRTLGMDETIRQCFFANRAGRLGNHPLIALDSTMMGTYSGRQIEARAGYDPGGEGLQVIKYIVLYAVESMQPVAFVKVPGNIPDSSTLPFAVEQLQYLGIHHPQLVTDNGYWSAANLGLMIQKGIDFITLAKPSIEWVAGKVDECRDTICTVSNLDPGGSGIYVQSFRVKHKFPWIRTYASTKKDLKAGDTDTVEAAVYVHVCFDLLRRHQEDVKFTEELRELSSMLEDGAPLEGMTKAIQDKAAKFLHIEYTKDGSVHSATFNSEACDAHCARHGFFVLIANKEKDGFEALRKYRKREYVEAYFGDEKQDVDGRRPRVWNADELMGRMMVQFVALCYEEFLRFRIRCVKDDLAVRIAQSEARGDPKSHTRHDRGVLKWLNATSLAGILRWFDAYENYRVSSAIRNHRWDAPTTERDRHFLMLLESDSV